ncbi:uncharacterized protein A4U43_C02F15460 [Asparagus officinalis]|uniref:Ribonuclease n=1 Tax=Asparagus officinalis TaxID=4686 RepID=A0A5P1FIN4_ASPOF|nr:uncharacterized protein A4U43_C02F15460 [Asparagus officinalis]
MASAQGATGWLRGKVKAVPSGDCLVIMGSTKAEIPPEKTITLSSIIAPRLARRGGIDEPFAWDSREYLRKLCIGKDVTFKVDYTVPSIGREFGSVFLGEQNVAKLVVEEGWVKVREQGQQKAEVSPFLSELQALEEQAKQKGLGRWSKASKVSSVMLWNEVRIVLEGVDKFSNLIGSLIYADGDTPKDLALELVQNGLAKYAEWSANFMENDAKAKLKAADLQAKKDRLRMWTNYVPPASNSKAIHDQNFTGTVVEVVSGDCIIVADDAAPYGSPLAERRVNLSSIRCPKLGNPRRNETPAAFAREAKELLRSRFIGRQVKVSMEYSRKVGDGLNQAAESGPADSRVMDFGSVFLVSPSKEGDDTTPTAPSGSQTMGVNAAELVLSRGYGDIIYHRDFEERSNYYDALLAAESRASKAKKGIHLYKERDKDGKLMREPKPTVVHITDLTTASAKKARDFLPFLQKSRRLPAMVEYVLSGHRFKLLIPKETCSIAFAFSGVRCPGRDEPFSDEAIALMRRKIMQREVEIEVETVDRAGTFLGSLWESKTNMAVALLQAGLAKLQNSFASDRIPDAHILARAEQSAKQQRLKVWENYVEGQEVANGSSTNSKQKEVLKVLVTEVLGGGKFYIQTVGDQSVAVIQKQLASLSLQEAPVFGTFNPVKGDIVLAQFSIDNSWNRAMIVNGPRGPAESPEDKYEVFYIDYGNQETVTHSRMRPLDPSVSSAPCLAQLCSLAFIKVPNLEDDFGQEAAEYLSDCTMNSSKEFRAMIEDKDTSGGKVKGQGTGTVFAVTLVDVEAETSVNAALLQEGLARLERKNRWDTRERKSSLDNLEEFQDKAKKGRMGIWQYGDVQSDDEESAPPTRKPAGRDSLFLFQVLTEPKNALGKQYKKLFSMNNVDAFVVDEEAIGSGDKPGRGAKILRGDGALDHYLTKNKLKGPGVRL